MAPMSNRLLVPRKTPGLLDLVPGAAAAYSLRSLSRSYADPVVTVRRSSDDAEEDFTASEVSDDTLAAFCGAGDGFVKQWWDQSGNARHATQTTPGYQPKIVSSGVVILEEGKPALQFDGTDDRLKASFSLLSQPNTIASVITSYKPTGEQPPGIAYDDNDGDNRNTYDSKGDAFAGVPLEGSDMQQNQQSIVFAMYDGSDSYCYRTGALDAQGNVGTQGLSGLTIGGRYTNTLLWEGTIQELIVYPSDLTEQRELIEGNIAWGWSV